MSKKVFEQDKILRAFRRFNDYNIDLLQSDYHTFGTRLEIFIDFCENDEIMGFITSQLKTFDFEAWMKGLEGTVRSMAGSMDFRLPLKEDDRISYLYQLILNINNKEIQFEGFSSEAFGSNNGDGMVYTFNEAITRPLIRDLGYKLEEIRDQIDELDRRELISQDKLIVINAGDITNSQLAIGTNIKLIQISKDKELDNLVNELADLILKDSTKNDEEKEDLLSDVETLKIELQKNKPYKERVMGYLQKFSTITSLVGASEKIIEYLIKIGIL